MSRVTPGVVPRLEFFVVTSSGVPVPSLGRTDFSAFAYSLITEGLYAAAVTVTPSSDVAATAAKAAGQFVTIDSAKGHYAVDCASGAASASATHVEISATPNVGTYVVHPVRAEIETRISTLFESVSGSTAPTVERSPDDDNVLTFAWPVSGATITATVSKDNGAYGATVGTVSFLRSEGGKHFYQLSYNVADRPVAEGTARYKFVDGTYTRYVNMRIAVSGGGGGDGAWTNEEVDYALEKLALLGVVADAVVVPAGAFLCGRGDIEQIFGTTAVAKWGDLNNNEDADEITARINYRISIADSYMRSTLGNSAWVLPEEGDAIPPILAYYTACLAGVLLYEGRGVQDYDARGFAQHQLSFHKKGVEDFVKGVLFGAISLSPLESNIASASPEAV